MAAMRSASARASRTSGWRAAWLRISRSSASSERRRVRARAFRCSMTLSSSLRMVSVFFFHAQNPWRNQRAVGRPLAAIR